MNWWAISQTKVPSRCLGTLRRGEGQRRGRHGEVAEGAGQAVRPGRAGTVTERGRTEAVPCSSPTSLLPVEEEGGGSYASPLLLLTSRLQ